MFKKALFWLVLMGLMTSNPVFAQYGQIARPATKAVKTVKMTPRQAMYHYAKTGNIKGLQQLKAQEYNIELLDKNGQSALCEAVWKNDRTAVSALIRIGANQNSQCMNKIPQSYKNAVGLQNVSPTVATTGTPGLPVATTATSTGLSTGAMVGIGVGAAALVGGGIALAAGGGGGGSGDKNSPAPCNGHGTQDETGACVCDAGYAGDTCETCDTGYGKYGTNECHATLACENGTQQGSSCVCETGYTGELCNTCASGYGNYGTNECHATLTCVNGTQQGGSCVCTNETFTGLLCDQCANGYGFYGTNECHATLGCKDGTQQGDECICNANSDGALCDTCKDGYDFYGTNECHATLACVNGTQQGANCVCSSTGWVGALCDTKKNCSGYEYSEGSCPTGYAISATCLSGDDVKVQCNNCADGYGKYGTNECYATQTCGTNEHQEGADCVCDTGYELIGGVCTFTSCPANQYKSGNECLACPENSTSPAGSTGIQQCTCNAGYTKTTAGLCVEQQANEAGSGYVYKLGQDTGYKVYNNEEDITSDALIFNLYNGTLINNATIERDLGLSAILAFEQGGGNIINNGTIIGLVQYDNGFLTNSGYIDGEVFGYTGTLTNYGYIKYVCISGEEGKLFSLSNTGRLGYLNIDSRFSPTHNVIAINKGEIGFHEKDDDYAVTIGMGVIFKNEGIIKSPLGGGIIVNASDSLAFKDTPLSHIINENTIDVMWNGIDGNGNSVELIQNKGNIFAGSTGIQIPSTVIENYGTITARDYGIRTYSSEAASIEIQRPPPKVVNTGNIIVNFVDVYDIGHADVYGISIDSVNGGSLYNNGNITVNDLEPGSSLGDHFWGIYASNSSPTETMTVVNGKQGNITINCDKDSQGYGIYAGGNVSVYNEGTITINGESYTGNEEFGDFIVLSGNATMATSGTLASTGTLNLSSFSPDGTGSVSLLNGGNLKAENIIGDLHIDKTNVASGFDTLYVAKDAIEAQDTTGLNLISDSHLFDASLADNGKDVLMTMKSFDDVTDNKSLASFLENNYANGNNEAFFNDIKSIGNSTAFTSAMDSLTGRDTIAKFTHEDLSAMREVNFTMNELMFANNDKPMFETNGSLNAFNFKNDNNSSAQYALANKRITPRMKIGYAMSTTNLNTDNDDDTTRRNSVFQVFAPISYDRSGWQMIATPQIGFARGHYTRKGYNGTSYEGVIEKRIFALMNEARYPMTVGKFEIAPTVEFNAIAYNTKGSEDEKAYSLTMPSDNSLSVEAGLGIYAKRNVGNMKFNAGLMVYREFADPYNIKMGMNGMEGTFDLYDNRSEYRGVASFGFGYDVGKLNVYGNVQHFMETDTHTKFKAGVKFGF